MDTAANVVYMRAILAPTLQPGQIVVLDNLAVHQANSVRALLEARGGDLWYLPAYSPDLHPVEEAVSKLNAGLRRLGARARAGLLEAIGLVFASIIAHDAHSGFTSACHAPCAHAAAVLR